MVVPGLLLWVMFGVVVSVFYGVANGFKMDKSFVIVILEVVGRRWLENQGLKQLLMTKKRTIRNAAQRTNQHKTHKLAKYLPFNGQGLPCITE